MRENTADVRDEEGEGFLTLRDEDEEGGKSGSGRSPSEAVIRCRVGGRCRRPSLGIGEGGGALGCLQSDDGWEGGGALGFGGGVEEVGETATAARLEAAGRG
jgi:hypothetical protein